MSEDIPGATAEWLDDLMAKQAVQVLFSKIPSTEQVAGRPGRLKVYMRPPEIGGFKIEVRMIVQCLPPTSGRTEVQVVEINAGVVDFLTGKIDYMQNPREVVDSETQADFVWSEITKSGGPSLLISLKVRQKFMVNLPWWLPVPGELLQAVLRPWISAAVRSSMSSVFRGLRERAQLVQARVPQLVS